MPIKGITDVKSVSLRSGNAVIAKLKKGAPKIEGQRPKDLTYFRIAFADGYQHLLPVFEARYGKQPDQIPGVLLLGSEIDQVFETWLEQWNGSTLVHRCTGSTGEDRGVQESFYNTETGQREKGIACIQPKCKCRKIGRLAFRLPLFQIQTGELGYFLIETTSAWDVISIFNRLLSIQAESRIPINQIPLMISRRKRQITMPDSENPGKRKKTTKSLIDLRISPDFVMEYMKSLMSQNSKMLGEGENEPLVLNSGVDDIPETDPETGEIIESAQDYDSDEEARAAYQHDERQEVVSDGGDRIDTDKKRTAFLKDVSERGIKSVQAVKALVEAGWGDDRGSVRWKDLSSDQAMSILFPSEIAEGEEAQF